MRMITGGLAAHVQEDKLLYEALHEHLGREPQVGDLARCIMRFTVGRPDEYILSYENDDLGKMKKDLRMEYDFEGDGVKIVYEACFYLCKIR
jgi:hypothetical protein